MTGMITIPAECVRRGDVVVEHDWNLHAVSSGVDAGGPYVEVREFPHEHLHLGAVLLVDPAPIELDQP